MRYLEKISNLVLKPKIFFKNKNNQTEIQEKRVFFSYSRKNREQVIAVQKFLEEKEIVVWRDQEKIYGGQTFYKEIENAIQDHEYFVVFLVQRVIRISSR